MIQVTDGKRVATYHNISLEYDRAKYNRMVTYEWDGQPHVLWCSGNAQEAAPHIVSFLWAERPGVVENVTIHTPQYPELTVDIDR